MDKQLALLQGTLDILILKSVSLGPLHGYGVLLRIQQISKDCLEIQQGSPLSGPISPRTPRLDHERMGGVGDKRKAKYYRLTAADKRKLLTETEKCNCMADVIARILHTTPGEV